MMFHPQELIHTEGRFLFWGEVHGVAHPCLSKGVIRDFWRGFSFQSSTLTLSPCETLTFSVGDIEPLPLNGSDYTVLVTEKGLAVRGKSEADLIRGFMTLLDRFEAVDVGESFAIEVKGCQIRETAVIGTRMVHFCVFPETELWELQRFVRFCGALRYTHIVLEFWGMLQYDCMRELAWRHGYTKDEVRPILREARDLGMEIIPMFNHWGHASAGRVIHGKHVVLDQNPMLQTYFSEDGWCWDIRKPKVRALLRRVREELMELCGEGSYFHVGCDEAYNFELTKENMDHVCDFLNEIAHEMRAVNRRAIVWGDMFLYNHPHYNPNNKYTCNAPTPEVERYMLERLSRDLVIADWQYDPVEAPVETAAVFTKAGFDCLLCPWDRGSAQMNAVLSTAREQELMGVLHTTWHTLTKGMPYVALVGMGGFETVDGWDRRPLRTCTAALLRKVMPIEGDYEKAGWSKIQVHSIWS